MPRPDNVSGFLTRDTRQGHSLRITFLGTGTSSGVPMIGCDCATCRSSDLRDRRLRPSIYIELPDGTDVLVDASPDLRAQALARQFSRVDAILLTHAHADHVLGLNDVRGFNVRMRRPIPCYGAAQTMGAVRRMFAYIFDPGTPRGGGIPQLVLHTLVGPFSLGRATFVPVPVYHGKSLILGYRVGDFAYLTDCSAIPDGSWPLLDGVQVLVLDALRERPHPTHLSLSQAVDVAGQIGAVRAYFTHICHDLPHAATCARLPEHVSLAYDGLVIDVD